MVFGRKKRPEARAQAAAEAVFAGPIDALSRLSSVREVMSVEHALCDLLVNEIRQIEVLRLNPERATQAFLMSLDYGLDNPSNESANAGDAYRADFVAGANQFAGGFPSSSCG